MDQVTEEQTNVTNSDNGIKGEDQEIVGGGEHEEKGEKKLRC